MNPTDPVIAVAKKKFEASEMTLEELGVRMGYPKEMARKSAWQLLNKTADPRIGTLRKFAAALGISVVELFDDGGKKSR